MQVSAHIKATEVRAMISGHPTDTHPQLAVLITIGSSTQNCVRVLISADEADQLAQQLRNVAWQSREGDHAA